MKSANEVVCSCATLGDVVAEERDHIAPSREGGGREQVFDEHGGDGGREQGFPLGVGSDVGDEAIEAPGGVAPRQATGNAAEVELQVPPPALPPVGVLEDALELHPLGVAGGRHGDQDVQMAIHATIIPQTTVRLLRFHHF